MNGLNRVKEKRAVFFTKYKLYDGPDALITNKLL